MPRILTGIQCTGRPHLGNVLGAMLPTLEFAANPINDTFIFLADLHTLTTLKDPQERRNYVYAAAAAWLALGLDPAKVTFYRQSKVPAVCELVWYLSCFTPYPMLANAHAFLQTATFILENGQYLCGSEIEKMSKSKYNTVNPDTIVTQYGADTLRLYTMFLGPIEQAKPWDINGIEGVFRFLVKVWRLFHPEKELGAIGEIPTKEEQKVIHKAIKKIEEDIKRYTFNTAVSNLMICVNELTALKCNNREILKNLVLILAPFAPHLAEELWDVLGHQHSITQAPFPPYEEIYLQEEAYEYPIAINGKVRAKINFPVETPQEQIEQQVLAHESIQKWVQGQPIKKLIIIPKKMVNIVV